ncbi:rho GTPase-activating protein [Actinomortierella wolfii]|nr:rho GTPase-activating protein [Actinomortierella wolfii]
MASTKPSNLGSLSKDKSPKAASSSTPNEAGPRKTVSHEGFQHAKSVSQSAALDSSKTTHSSPQNTQSSSLSAFSYLKQKLFGSVADASSSFSSSARDLLQSKKGQGNDASKAKAATKDSSGSSGTPAAPSSGSSLSPASSGGRSRFAAKTLPARQQPLALQQHFAPTPHPPPNTATTTATDAPTVSISQHQHQQPLTPSATSGVSSAQSASVNTLSRSPHSSPTLVTTASVTSDHNPTNSNIAPDKLSASSASGHGQSQLVVQTDTPSRVSYSQARNSNYRLSTLSSHKSVPTASIIYQEGFLNKKVDMQPGEIGHGWKVYKVILRGTKLYFFKPLPFEEKPKFQEPRDNQRQIEGFPAQPSPSRLSLTNESGMVLTAFKFESSTRTLLFEGNPKPLHPQSWALAPLVSKYVYGECFTELDRMSMQPKKHVALLLFEDCIVICKRKWIRFPSTKMKDVIKFNNQRESEDRASASPTSQHQQRRFNGPNINSPRSPSQSQRQQQDRSTEKEKHRGYFTKWKHEAMYSLSQVEALDMASPVPSASNTFFPFVTPSLSTTTSTSTLNSRTSRETENSSATLTLGVPFIHQTTSTLELVITTSIDGKEYTQRLLFLPPSPEVRHMWYSKFHRTKERYVARSRTMDGGVRSTLPSNHSTQSLASSASPSRPSFDQSSFFDPQNADKSRVFVDSSMHPELQTGTDMSGVERLVAASVQGLVHELVYHNIPNPGMDILEVFTTTIPLFTTAGQVLKTLRQIIKHGGHAEAPKKAAQIVQAQLCSYNARADNKKVLDELQSFIKDTLASRLNDDTQIAALLSSIDQKRSTEAPLALDIQVSSNSSDSAAGITSVDLSNVLITGLTPAVFLKLDPSHFAEQILHYHANHLNDAGGLERLLDNPAFFMRRYPTAGSQPSIQSPLVFSMFSPHFLTVLITHHILIATQSLQSISRRPMLLAHWIKTGRACRALGDMAGFVAIAIGICSPGIVRLQETWKDIDHQLQDEVATSWVPMLVEMEMITEEWQRIAASAFGSSSGLNQAVSYENEHERSVIPCLSRVKQAVDILDRNQPSFVQATPTPLLNVEKLNSIASTLRGAKSSMMALNLRSSVILLQRPAIPHIQQYFGHLASISQSLHDQFHSNELINDAFESSLACEPHFNGQYLDYHYKNRKMASSYIPLLFPEAVLTHRLFHQQTLLALENTGNTCHKSSVDEEQDHPSQTPTGVHSSGSPFRRNTPASSTHLPTNVQPDWANGDSTATHPVPMHHVGASGGGSLGYARTRKRTYSFPPSRAASRESTVVGGRTPRSIVNMVNPHLDSVTREWLKIQSSQMMCDQGSNEILRAMQDLAGIGCKPLLMEGGELIMKVRDESLDSLAQSAIMDGKNDNLGPWRTSPLSQQQHQTQSLSQGQGLQSQYQRQGSNRSSAALSIHGTRRLVTVKAGTLEMLVQVLVMGLQNMSGYAIDETGGAMLLTSRQLVFDHSAYAASFFATYRSFCSAGGLLEHLVTMFTFAQQSTLSRAMSGGIPSSLNLFSRPVTMSPDSSIVVSGGANSVATTSSGLLDWKSILAMQRNVLSTVEYWLKHHVSDFLDSLVLKNKLCEALDTFSVQEQTQTVLVDALLAEEVAALKEQLVRLKRLALQQTMRPSEGRILFQSLERLRDYLGTPPASEPTMDNQGLDAQTLLEQMNLSALRHFLSIGQQEWFVLFEILESQSADPLGWYMGKAQSSSSDDELVITNIDHILYSIRRSGVAGSHWNGERLINAIPICLQKLCKLHHTLRSWVISQVADPNISYESRLSRVQRFVDVVLLSREEMRHFDLQACDAAARSTLSSVASVSTSKSGGGGGGSMTGGGNSGTARRASVDFNKIRKLPSFVESAVVSALISPESRAYTRIWHDVAASRHGTVDSFEDMLGECTILSAKPSTSPGKKGSNLPMLPRLAPATAHEGLVPSVGWLIERMIEACCYVRDMSYESPILVNFDKRRYIFDLVQIFIQQQQALDRMSVPIAQPLASWLCLAAGTSPSNLNFKAIREASNKESQAAHSRFGGFSAALSGGGGSGHRNQGSRSGSRGVVFGRLVAAQQEKAKRDLKEYEKLEKQIKDTQGRIQKAQQEHAKSLEKQIKMEQSRSRVKNQLLKTTLLRAVRPISLAISNSFSLATTTVSNATAQGTPITSPTGSGSAAAAAVVAVSGGVVSGGHTTDGSESSIGSENGFGARLLGHTRLDDPRRLGTSAIPMGSTPPIQPRSTSLSNNNNSSGGGGNTVAAKPALVINLINASCSIAYTYTKRDYVFKIVMEEGHQSLLQALDYDDMIRWINIVNEAAAEATAKRRTLLQMEEGQQQQDSKEGNSSSQAEAESGTDKQAASPASDKGTEPVLEDVSLSVDVNERKGRKSVFGVELRHLMPDGRIPDIVEKCITEIEKRGLDEVGIYRVPGAVSAINKLCAAFNEDSAAVDLESDEWKDINVVAGALKQFLRELPEAVMTSALYEPLIAASALEDYDERLMTIKDLVHTLPLPNYLLLKRIIEHLERVTDFEEINHMYATNLAIVFGPTLVRPGGASASSFARSMKNLGHQQAIVKNMILQYHWLFDVEQEGGREDDNDNEQEGQKDGEEAGEENREGGAEEDLTDNEVYEEEEGTEVFDAEEYEDGHGDLFRSDAGVFQLRLPQRRQVTNDQLALADLSMAQPVTDTTGEKLARDQRRRTVIFG